MGVCRKIRQASWVEGGSADTYRQWAFEGHGILPHALYRGGRDDGLAVFELWRHVDGFPVNWRLTALGYSREICGLCVPLPQQRCP